MDWVAILSTDFLPYMACECTGLYVVYIMAVLYPYYDKRRDIRWNIAWARGESRGRPRDFQRAQAIIHCISRLQSLYRHSQFLKVILPVLSFLVWQYWKSWFSVLVWQLGLYILVMSSRWSKGPYRPSRELCCGNTRKYTWSGAGVNIVTRSMRLSRRQSGKI